MPNRRSVVAVIVAPLLASCATAELRGYVGKPLTEAIFNRGQPSTAFDMPDGTRAFSWSVTQSGVLPGSVNTTGNVAVYGNNGYYTQNSTIVPPQTFDYTCNYTIFARKTRPQIEGPSAWDVVSIREPSIWCA